jgi:hypothetical protein
VLSPPGQGTADASVPVGILALAKRGMLTLGSPGDGRSYPALPRSQRGKHSAAELLAARSVATGEPVCRIERCIGLAP